MEAVDRVDLGLEKELSQAAAWRKAVPQRQHHIPAPVLLQQLPSRRPHRRPGLRHRGRRHWHGADRQSHAPRRQRHGALQVGPASTRASSASAAPRLAVFFTRIQPVHAGCNSTTWTTTSAAFRARRTATGSWAKTSRNAQRRGKTIFDRASKNDGTLIPVENRCVTCHPPPLYTDGKVHKVGTKFAYDRDGKFDTAPTAEHLRFRTLPAQRHRAPRSRRFGPNTIPTINTASPTT